MGMFLVLIGIVHFWRVTPPINKLGLINRESTLRESPKSAHLFNTRPPSFPMARARDFRGWTGFRRASRRADELQKAQHEVREREEVVAHDLRRTNEGEERSGEGGAWIK